MCRRLLPVLGWICAMSITAGCTLLLSSDLEGNGVSNGADAKTDASSGGCVGADCLVDGRSGGDGNIGPTNDASDGSLGNSPCPSFAYFCDDFESGDLSKWNVVKTNGGDVSVDTSIAHAGTRSAHAVSNSNAPVDGAIPTDRAEMQANLNASKTSGLMVIRVYVFMKKGLSSDTTILKYTAPGDDDMNLKIDSSGVFLVDTDHPGAGPEILASMAPPLNKWFCLEWRVTVGVQGHQTVLLDGQTIVDADEDTLTPPGYNGISVGFTAAKLDQEIYYDDVVLADQAIGCF